jgi:peptidoglycan/LPS O-acetylase OafA/YrhL
VKAKLGSLEVGRFIAASLVVISHVAPTVNNYAARADERILPHFDVGPLGVAYFFVLSGFVMASNHAKDFGRLAAVPEFLWRRACRIFPMFWLAMTIPIYCQFAALKPAAMAQLLSLVPIDTAELLPPAWTLRYEVAFYLVFSLCLLPYLGRALLAVWMIVVLWTWSPCGVLRYVVPAPPAVLTYLANSPADHFFNFDEFYFFAGIFAGLAFVKFAFPARAALVLLTVSAIGFVAGLSRIGWGARYGSPDMMIAMGLVMGCLMLSLARLEQSGILKIGPLAQGFGAVSYPLYILHWSLFWVAASALPHWRLHTGGLVALFVAGIAGIFLIATAATFGFDQPVQRWLRGLGRKKDVSKERFFEKKRAKNI